MSKERIDVLVMFTAFVLGGYFSAITNPVMGIALLVGVMSIWTLFSNMPVLKKEKVKINDK